MSRRAVAIGSLITALFGLALLLSSSPEGPRVDGLDPETLSADGGGAQLDGRETAGPRSGAAHNSRSTPVGERSWAVRCQVIGPGQAREAAEPWPGIAVALELVNAAGTARLAAGGTTNGQGRCLLGPVPASIWTPALLHAVDAHVRLRAMLPDGRTRTVGLGTPARLRAALEEAHALAPRQDPVVLDHAVDARQANDRRVRTCTKDGIDLCGLHLKQASRPPRLFESRANFTHTHWIQASPKPGYVEARLAGNFVLLQRVDLPAVLPRDAPYDMVIDEETIVRGRLLDAHGKPLPRVHVVLQPAEVGPNRPDHLLIKIGDHYSKFMTRLTTGHPTANYSSRQSTRTDSAGRFAFAGLKDGTDYHLFWGDTEDHWHREPRPVRRGDPPLEYRISQSGFRVRVRDAATGAALPHAVVRVHRVLDPTIEIFTPAVLKPASDFTVAGPGEAYRVTVANAGYESQDLRVAVKDGEVETVTVELTPLADPPTLQFVLVDDTGRPINTIGVEAHRGPPGSNFSGQAYARIRALPRRAGNTITIGPLPAGQVRVRFHSLGTAGARAPHRFLQSHTWIGATPSQGVEVVQIVVPRGGRLVARFHLPNKAPPPQAGRSARVSVRVGPEDDGSREPMQWTAKTPSGMWLKASAASAEVFDGCDVESGVLAPGTYTLTVGATHPDHEQGVLTETIVVIKPGAVSAVEVDLDAAPPAPEPPADDARDWSASCG